MARRQHGTRRPPRAVLRSVDDAFAAAAEDVAGQAIAWAVRGGSRARAAYGWWWTRRPRRIPWSG